MMKAKAKMWGARAVVYSVKAVGYVLLIIASAAVVLGFRDLWRAM